MFKTGTFLIKQCLSHRDCSDVLFWIVSLDDVLITLILPMKNLRFYSIQWNLPKSTELVLEPRQVWLTQVPVKESASEKTMTPWRSISLEHPFIMGERLVKQGETEGPVPHTQAMGHALSVHPANHMGIAGCEVLCRVWEITEPGFICLCSGWIFRGRGVRPVASAGAWLFLSLEPWLLLGL